MELIFMDRLPESNRHRRHVRRHDVFEYIIEFLESGRNVAHIHLDPGEYLSANTCVASFTNAINRWNIQGVYVVVRNDEPYLVRE